METFGVLVEDVGKANRDVSQIIGMVKQNVVIVAEAVRQIEKISGVVEENVQISHETRQASSHMADITGKLLRMVGE